MLITPKCWNTKRRLFGISAPFGCLTFQHFSIMTRSYYFYRCHHVTGECQCPPGLTGQLCNESCPLGSWGIGCAELCNCSSNGGGGKCNPVTGFCECSAGWMGRNCEFGLILKNFFVRNLLSASLKNFFSFIRMPFWFVWAKLSWALSLCKRRKM